MDRIIPLTPAERGNLRQRFEERLARTSTRTDDALAFRRS
jgi:hypothetical protein